MQAHGWRTEGRCECGEADTLAHRLEGCPIREACPVRGISPYKDFWALLATPPLPPRRHPRGLSLDQGVGEDIYFDNGHIFQDGSVKCPGGRCWQRVALLRSNWMTGAR